MRKPKPIFSFSRLGKCTCYIIHDVRCTRPTTIIWDILCESLLSQAYIINASFKSRNLTKKYAFFLIPASKCISWDKPMHYRVPKRAGRSRIIFSNHFIFLIGRHTESATFLKINLFANLSSCPDRLKSSLLVEL